MTSEEILKERERIKELHSRMLDELIEKRKLLSQKRSKRAISISDARKLQERFFWYVHNPDYKRKGSDKK